MAEVGPRRRRRWGLPVRRAAEVSWRWFECLVMPVKVWGMLWEISHGLSTVTSGKPGGFRPSAGDEKASRRVDGKARRVGAEVRLPRRVETAVNAGDADTSFDLPPSLYEQKRSHAAKSHARRASGRRETTGAAVSVPETRAVLSSHPHGD